MSENVDTRNTTRTQQVSTMGILGSVGCGIILGLGVLLVVETIIEIFVAVNT